MLLKVDRLPYADRKQPSISLIILGKMDVKLTMITMMMIVVQGK